MKKILLLAFISIAHFAPLTAESTLVVGHYVFPVSSTGDITYGSEHHDYPATDIFCPPGSIFRAVTDGVVDHISTTDTWDQAVNDPETRGGLSVAIIGDDGIRYYGSHLSAIAEGLSVGQRVKTRQTLGYTGDTGNARVTPPHVHFGISRPTTADDWATRRGEISPYLYLRLWERGDAMVPRLRESQPQPLPVGEIPL